jgi:two-component system sensor histidine kinase ArlS
MRNVKLSLNKLPMKWRLALWSSIFIVILFVMYAGTQYWILNQWAMDQEKQSIQQNMNEIELYYQNNMMSDIQASKSFLNKYNQKNQMIRIVDSHGKPVLTVNDDFPEKWVTPLFVQKQQFESKWHMEDHYLTLRSPLNSGVFIGTIEIARNLESFEKLNKVMLSVMGIGGVIGVALSLLGGILLARQFIKPISALTKTIISIKHNGLKERVAFIENKDELSRLSQMFNEMMDRLELSFKQQKQFVEDASHELRTPIAIIEGHLKMLKRWGKDDRVILEDSLNASLEELLRLETLSQELLAVTRAEAIAPSIRVERLEPILPFETVHQIVSDFRMLYPEFIFELRLRANDDTPVPIKADHWKQIIMIVLDNAVKYSTKKQVIELEGNRTDNAIQLQIRDYGIGIPHGEINQVFDRFYRVDKARGRLVGGSGLGLAIAKRIIESYEGRIEIASKVDEGTLVTLKIPCTKKALPSQQGL